MKVLPLLLICLVPEFSKSQNTLATKISRIHPPRIPSRTDLSFIEPILRSIFERGPFRTRIKRLKRPLTSGRLRPSVEQTSVVRVFPKKYIKNQDSPYVSLPQNVWIFPNPLPPFTAQEQQLPPLKSRPKLQQQSHPPKSQSKLKPKPPPPPIREAPSLSSFEENGFGKPKPHSVIQMGHKKHLIKNQISHVFPDIHKTSSTSSSQIQKAITIFKPKPLKVISKPVIKLAAPPPSLTFAIPEKTLSTSYVYHPHKIRKPFVPHQQIFEENFPFILEPLVPPKPIHPIRHPSLQNTKHSNNKVPEKNEEHQSQHDSSYVDEHSNNIIQEHSEEHLHHSSQNNKHSDINFFELDGEHISHQDSSHNADHTSNGDPESNEENVSFHQVSHITKHSNNKVSEPHEEQVSHLISSQNMEHSDELNNINHFDMDNSVTLDDSISLQEEDDEHTLNQLNSVPEKDSVDVSLIHDILKTLNGPTTVPVPDVNAGILPLANEVPQNEYHNFPPFTLLQS